MPGSVSRPVPGSTVTSSAWLIYHTLCLLQVSCPQPGLAVLSSAWLSYHALCLVIYHSLCLLQVSCRSLAGCSRHPLTLSFCLPFTLTLCLAQVSRRSVALALRPDGSWSATCVGRGSVCVEGRSLSQWATAPLPHLGLLQACGVGGMSMQCASLELINTVKKWVHMGLMRLVRRAGERGGRVWFWRLQAMGRMSMRCFIPE